MLLALAVPAIGGAIRAQKGCERNHPALPYCVVDTGQTSVFSDIRQLTRAPRTNEPFFGQDAQYQGRPAAYTISRDGLTVLDNNTGLTWERSPAADGHSIPASAEKLTMAGAQARPAALNAARYAGLADWRLPTIKELYSLIDFRGTDPSGYSGTDTAGLRPFIDTRYFRFSYGEQSAGERIIDSQYASSTMYVGLTRMGGRVFGVNFADGRIKGYDLLMPNGGEKTFYVLCVRGNARYGMNDLRDDGDETITDRATGLMWTKKDSGKGLNWEQALAWASACNRANYLGHSDWRLPHAKELQSIVDYSRSPDTTRSAAISPLFNCSPITNEANQSDYACYWTGTTHAILNGRTAVYVAFGRAMGYMMGRWVDVHGAGAQRSDPKSGNPADFPYGRGPQGDAIRIYNYARLVRNVDTTTVRSVEPALSLLPADRHVGEDRSVRSQGGPEPTRAPGGIPADQPAIDAGAPQSDWPEMMATPSGVVVRCGGTIYLYSDKGLKLIRKVDLPGSELGAP